MNWLAMATAALAALRQLLSLLGARATAAAGEAGISARQKARSYDRLQKAISIREGIRNSAGSGDDAGMRDTPYRRRGE